MDTSSVLLGIAIILSIVYGALAVAAFGHMKPEHRSSDVDRLLAFTPWWAFYDDLYRPSAKRYRVAAIVILVLCVAAYVLLFNLR
jgi:hypothetical protein